jgi:methylaspartate mutase epsilon subunit
MMAEQGAQHMRLHFLAQGNLVQDVAGATTVRKLAQDYFNRFGYRGVSIFLSVSLSLVKYPVEPGPAYAVISYNSLLAKLCGAQLNDVRTAVEAITIPTKEDIAQSFRCAKVATNLLKGQKIEIDRKALEMEANIVELETRAIVDRVIGLGDGDPVVGMIRAVEAGALDNPFASHPAVACKVMGVRDNDGAVRYLNTGHLPFPSEIVEFNKEKIAEREKRQRQKVNYETVVSDLLSISTKGLLVE